MTWEQNLYAAIIQAVPKMTLSASGWRGVFNAERNEQSSSALLSAQYAFISYFAATAFFNFLQKHHPNIKEIVLARDGRPTGEMIERVVDAAFTKHTRRRKCNLEVRTIGIASIPEVISYAASRNAAFFYISASHNPIGYNGFKFGIGTHGVLEREEAQLVVWGFRGILAFGTKGIMEEKTKDEVEWAYQNKASCEQERSQDTFLYEVALDITCNLFVPIGKIEIKKAKTEALQAYKAHIKKVVSTASNPQQADEFFSNLQEVLKSRSLPIYVICDFNGSARAASIDASLFKKLSFKFISFNDEAGKIAHEIIPEGKNLDFLCHKMQTVYKEKKGRGLFFGYMPDCDGDRGNIAYLDEEGAPHIIKSQEVFALAILAETLHARKTGCTERLAVVANGPTSMLIDEIASMLDFAVFRAEVGEANVVNLAKAKSSEGYNVRILGEGSNGGCIVPPSLVRDPLCTIFSLLKFFLLDLDISPLSSFSEAGLSSRVMAPVETASPSELTSVSKISSRLASRATRLSSFSQLLTLLPHYETTSVSDEHAILHIYIEHVRRFRGEFQKLFMQEWKERSFSLFEKYHMQNYKAFSYSAGETIEVTDDFARVKEGGFKIVFYTQDGQAIASIWMRQSGTEPVFRLMADLKDGEAEDEKALLLWQKGMIDIAKKGNSRE